MSYNRKTRKSHYLARRLLSVLAFFMPFSCRRTCGEKGFSKKFSLFVCNVSRRIFAHGNFINLLVFDKVALTNEDISAIVQLHHSVPYDANTQEE